ncbi:MAG: peptidylprolyl isomerase [Ignavibacteria bacterium]
MHKRILSALLVTILLMISSCSPEHSKIIVAEYGNEKITIGELERVYAKNVGGIEVAQKDSLAKIKSFLDLYVNFRMKLKDAQVRGFDNMTSLQTELADYKEKVGSSYLIEKKVIEPGIKELYNKRKYELRVSHLMIRPDTISDAEAKKKADELMARIIKGEKFEDLVAKYSSDSYSKSKGGDIYYITAGAVIPEFEDAAYNTPVGQVYPEAVKTHYGYHIIKVTEKRERIPSVRASHILIDFKSEYGKPDTAGALARAKDIKDKINKGEDFAKLAREYSKDPGTKEAGGDLGFFERRQMVKEFDDVVFNLKTGQVSEPVKSNFGYHIIKLTDTKPYPSFEDNREELKQLHKRTRYDIDYESYLKKLKSDFKYSVNNNTFLNIVKNCDTTKIGKEYFESKWRNTLKDSVIYSYNGAGVIVDSFFKKMEDFPDFNGKLVNESILTTGLNKISESLVINSEVKNLEKKDEQFSSLMDDYKNGIYIFKIQDDEIWSKIKIDSLKLVDFYNQNKSQYNWDDRAGFQEIFLTNDSLITACYSQLQSGVSFDTLAFEVTERPGYKEKFGKYELTDLKQNVLAEEAYKLEKVGDYTKPFKNSSGQVIIKLLAKEPARSKTFEEARAEVSSQFQEAESRRLENEYIDNLKNLYKPVLYSDKIEEAFKKN